MNEIERILKKYFSDEEIEYRSLSGRLDDPAWMEKQGYTKMAKSGFGISNGLTPEGKGKRISELIRDVSGYAMSDRSECMAECVADYVANGEKASVLSREVWKVLKRELG